MAVARYLLLVPVLAALILTTASEAQTEPATTVTVAELESLLTALEIAAEALPRDSFDPQAVVDEVGSDPEALFAWVRDNTFLVPYRGVLRGPTGVLQDRMGNSLDRALLLRDLLRRAGHDAILVNGTLTLDQATALLTAQGVLPIGEHAVAPVLTQEENDRLLEEIDAATSIDVANLRDEMAASRERAARLSATVAQRSDSQSDALLTVMAPTEASTSISLEMAEPLVDHWWVEIQRATDLLTLDPSLPATSVGEALTTPRNRYSPTDLNQLRGLPDMAHTIVLRVVVERLEEDRLVEEVVFEHELFPAQLHGRRIMLGHAPADAGEEDLLSAPDVQARFSQVLASHEEWTPVLLVGEESLSQNTFTNTGEVKSQAGGDVGAVGGLGGGLFGGFGGAASGQAAPSHLTAEWVEYQINVPGRLPIIERRAVFDLIGPSARASGPDGGMDGSALTGSIPALAATNIEIVPLSNRVSGAYLDYLRARAVVESRELLTAVVAGEEIPAPGISDVPGLPVLLAQASQAWGEEPLFHDRLSLYTFHYQTYVTPEGLSVVEAFDVVHDGMVGSVDPEGAYEARVRRGVLLTNAEALLIPGDGPVIGNAGEEMAADMHAGVEWTLLVPGEEEALDQLPVPADVAAMMRAHLEEGYAVIAPIHSGGDHRSSAWWRIDPATGHTLGFGARGWGQGLKEYLKLVDKISSSFLCYAGALEGHSGNDLKTGAKLALCLAGNSTLLLKGDRVDNFNLVMSLIGKVIGFTGLKSL